MLQYLKAQFSLVNLLKGLYTIMDILKGYGKIYIFFKLFHGLRVLSILVYLRIIENSIVYT